VVAVDWVMSFFYVKVYVSSVPRPMRHETALSSLFSRGKALSLHHSSCASLQSYAIGLWIFLATLSRDHERITQFIGPI
jgi:hypothetical protein